MVLLSILLGVIFFSCHSKDDYRVAVFKTGDGWGYRIESREKIYIEQPFIPGIEGTYTFKTKEEAMRTGSLVLQKLMEKKNPAVHPQELDSLQVTYPRH